MLVIIPIFFLMLGAEWLYGKYKGKSFYRFNDTITNLNIGVGNQVFSLLLKSLLIGLFIGIYQQYAFFKIETTWWSIAACLLLFDFLYYWAHRWGHEVNFFWGAHVVHHQSEDYNLGVALRQSWFHNLIASFIFLPIPLLGFEPVLFLGVSGIATLYQFWIHTEAIDKMPKWFEFIFNTPSHHRVHHARDSKYIDKNYSAIFIFWDRIFGTFRKEEERPVYGIVNNFKSWNPTWANFRYYGKMWEMAKAAASWKEALYILVARPGWKPVSMVGFEAVPTKTEQTPKFDAQNKPMAFYVSMQFLLIIFGLMAYMHQFDVLPLFFKVGLAGLILLSATICGGIMENKKWYFKAEYLKLVAALIMLNTLYYTQYIDWFLIMLICSTAGFLVLMIWLGLTEKRWLQFEKA